MVELEKNVESVLKFGVVLSAALMIFGILLLIITGQLADLGANGQQNAAPGLGVSFSFSTILHEILRLNGIGFLFLGIIVLIMTPVARVFTSVVIFAWNREPVYFIITTIVFTDLMVAILLIPRLLH